MPARPIDHERKACDAVARVLEDRALDDELGVMAKRLRAALMAAPLAVTLQAYARE